MDQAGIEWSADNVVRSTDLPPAAPGGHPQTADDLETELARATALGAPRGAERLQERAQSDWERIVDVCPPDWCHGDLHPGNVVRRTTRSPGLLIGFNPRRAPWIFDAGWIAGTALALDARPLYRWLFDLLRDARQVILGEHLTEADYDLAVRLTAGWYALTCWSRRSEERRRHPGLLRLVESQIDAAVTA